ncbi:MAG: hypothetical protein GY790_20405 [Bacteroidetes bacterium]|nr:hypothetical protein [Bacteroidota bacterium]
MKKGLFFTAVLFFMVLPGVFSQEKPQNLIQIENARPGTRDWMLTNTYIDPDTWWRSPRIEGYCSEMSVRAGDTLKIMVSTNPVTEFSLEIFRTGYYGGDGGRSMKRFDSLQGTTQPDPPVGNNLLRECQWEPSVEFVIPDDWVSGVYLGKLSTKTLRDVYQSRLTANKDGLQSYVIFIVRDDRPCELLFQCSDLSWAAYNSWPDDRWSLYHNDKEVYNPNGRKKWSTDAAETGWASFDRPYANFCQDHLVDRPSSVGSGEFLLWEFPLSYWMEKQGYDVSYISNLDVHVDPLSGLLRAKGFISVGHDEYWSMEMFDKVSAARDGGLNLAFLSGNSVWGVVPLLPSSTGQPHRIIHRKGLFTGEFTAEQLKEPMIQQVIQSMGKYPPGPSGAQLMGGLTAGISGGDWICRNHEHWLYEGTGLQESEEISDLIGWEYHGFPAMDLPGMEVLAYSPITHPNGNPLPPHVATMYNGAKGNVVFNAGTIWFAQKLSSPPGHVLPSWLTQVSGPDPSVQRMTENLFERFIQ